MILDQLISNFPSATWFREVADEQFNEPDPVVVAAVVAIETARPTAHAKAGFTQLVERVHERAEDEIALNVLRLLGVL